MIVAVVGATGFIGRSVVVALEGRGHVIRPISAPRVCSMAETITEVERDALNCTSHLKDLGEKLQGVDVAINAAGVADAESVGGPLLVGANAVLPRCIQEATLRLSGSVRLVHVSSAAVLGAVKVLTSSPHVNPFSPYSQSKALGELGLVNDADTVILRPMSVHGEDRAITRRVARVARSKWSSVAGDGSNPSPQALVENVGDAVATLATVTKPPPRIVLYPWEGLTTYSLLTSLGNGSEPARVPSMAARLVVDSSRLAGRASARTRANSRRLEMFWFGQQQEVSWLTARGWLPQRRLEAWQHLGSVLAEQETSSGPGKNE